MTLDIVTIFPRMVDGPLHEGVIGRALARGLLAGAGRGGDGDEAGAVLPGGRGDRDRAGASGRCRAPVAAGSPLRAPRRGALERAFAPGAALRAVRGDRRARAGTPGDRGAVDRRLRVDRRGAAR